MPYEGEILDNCPLFIDFNHVHVVVVSGASWNPCGHMLICTGTNRGNSLYFHVAGQGVYELYGIYTYPKFMYEDGYKQYLRENGKHELTRTNVKVINPHKAHQELINLMGQKWFWMVLPHNCAAFVEKIIEAGGGNLSVMLNCPDQEVFHRIGSRFDGLGSGARLIMY